MKLNLKIGAALLAAAGLTAGLADASTIAVTGGEANFSLEGETIYGSTGTTTLPAIQVTLQADYTLQDNITVALSGATISNAGTTTNLNVNGGTSGAPANGIHCWAPGAPATENSIIVSLINVTGNNIAIRVTQKNVASSVGNICRVQGIVVTSPSIAVLTTVNVTWNAATATTNIPFDSSGTPTALAQTVSQFVSNWGTAGNPPAIPAETPLQGIVDVSTGRLYFANTASGGLAIPPGPTNNDLTTVYIQDLAAGPSAAGLATAGNFFFTGSPIATLTNTVQTLTGNFQELAFATGANAGKCSYASATAATALVITNAGAGVLSGQTVPTNCSSVSLTLTPAGAGEVDTTKYKFDGSNQEKIAAPQNFSATVVWSYSGPVAAGGTATGSRTDSYTPGSWKLNGFSAFVSYMPFGTGLTQILYLTNKSATQSGAVTFSNIYNDSGTACPDFTTAASIGSATVKNLGPEFNAGILACYGASFGGKVSFNVIANVPNSTAELYSAYNAGGGNRVSVLNTSNGRVTTTQSGTVQSTTGTSL